MTSTNIKFDATRTRLVTFDGHIGSGAMDVGRKVAGIFKLRFFDQVMLPSASEPANSDEAMLFIQRDANVYDRVWRWVEKASSYFAIGAAGDDPLLQTAADLHLPLTWDINGPRASATASDLWTLDEVALHGDAVVVHRAGAVEFANEPNITKVGLFAEWDDRVTRLMQREGIRKPSEAESILLRREESQRRYYHDAHSADPEDHGIYDIVLNTSETRIEMATMIVSRHLESAVAVAS